MDRLPYVRLDRGIWHLEPGVLRYYGRIIPEASVIDGWVDINGPEIWRCHHLHESSEEAFRCAEEELLRRAAEG